MPYVKKTIPELANIIKQHLSSELGLDVALIDDASLINVFSKVIAATQTESYADIEYFTKQAFPTLSEEEGLREWGLIKGIEWVTSRVASGDIDFTGVNGSTIPVGTILTNAAGDEYITLTLATIAAGVATTDVDSVEGGLDKNLDSGESLTFISTPTGLDNPATVAVDGLTAGTDAWTTDQYRDAVVASFSEPARGGSDTDYEYWTKFTLDARAVWVYGYDTHPSDITKGDVEVYFTMDAYAGGIPPVSDRNRVQAYIDTVRPVGMGELICPLLAAEDIYYDITISPLTDDTKAAVQESLEALHATIAPGGDLTTGQMNRAISNAEGVVDFVLNKVDTVYPPVAAPAVQSGTNRYNILIVGTPFVWS